MPDNNLFDGLDISIFGQPDHIDVSDFNKTVEPPVEPKETVDDKGNPVATAKPDATTKDSDLIDPTEFFNAAKTADTDKDTTDEPVTPTGDNDKSAPEEIFKAWAEEFKSTELLNDSDLEGFDGSMESLIAAFKTREERVGLEMVDDYKTQVPPLIKHLMDNWEEGVPLNELVNIKSNQIRYSAISDEKLEESVDTQKAVYAEYLRKTTKYSEAKIEKELTRLVDLDELKDESKEVLGELKKFEAEAEETLRKETKKEQERRREENAKTIKAYEKVVNETSEVIPGLKLTEKEQKDVLNKIINPVGIDGFGNPVSYIASLRGEDPYKFDTAVTYLATITKGFTDFSKVIKAGQTKAVKDLEGVINTPPPKGGKDNIKTTGKETLLDLLEKNKGIFKKN